MEEIGIVQINRIYMGSVHMSDLFTYQWVCVTLSSRKRWWKTWRMGLFEFKIQRGKESIWRMNNLDGSSWFLLLLFVPCSPSSQQSPEQMWLPRLVLHTLRLAMVLFMGDCSVVDKLTQKKWSHLRCRFLFNVISIIYKNLYLKCLIVPAYICELCCCNMIGSDYTIL